MGAFLASEPASSSDATPAKSAIVTAAEWAEQLEPDFASVQCSSGDYHIRVRRLAFCVAPIDEPAVVPLDDATFRYRVLVEKGLDTATNDFAKAVGSIRADDDICR